MQKTCWIIVATLTLVACVRHGLSQDRKVINFGGRDQRVQLRTFREFIVFDENISSAGRDRTQLNAILDQFQRDYVKDAQKLGDRIVLPPGFRLTPGSEGGDRRMWQITKNDFTPEDIRSLVAEMARHVRAGDIVFAYVMCHGRTNPDGTEVLVTPGASGGSNELSRKWLREQLEFRKDGKRTHLTVFITDACSTSVGDDRPIIKSLDTAIWKSLYFAHEGTVDIPTSLPGQPAYSIGGSVFLDAFVATFKYKREQIDAGIVAGDGKGDGIVEWSDTEYFGLLRRELNRAQARALESYYTAIGSPTDAFKDLQEDGRQVVEELRSRKQELRELKTKDFRINQAQK